MPQNSIKNKIPLLLSLILSGITSVTMAAEKSGDTDNKILATVNGQSITSQDFMRYQRQRGMPHDSDVKAQQQKMIEELINLELVYQDALKNGMDDDNKMQIELQAMKKQLYAGAQLRRLSETLPISDEELKKEYETRNKDLGTNEYKASHILLESEQDAKDVIAALDKGGKFDELAKQKSTGPSAPHGGDLGWFKPQEMVKPFSDAVAALTDGKYTKTPVKSDFGWHVILRTGERQIPPPSYDEVKEELKMRVRNIQVEQYIKSLRDSAKIERQK